MADAGALRARHGELREQLRNNSFQRAMHIDSSEAGDTLKGDVYAVLEHPFGVVGDALKDPSDWCDILILPFNTKYCHAVDSNGATALQVRIGRKYDQPVEKAYRLDFALRPVAATPDYFESRLERANRPARHASDYRIAVSAVPLDGGRTFMHLSYSYGYRHGRPHGDAGLPGDRRRRTRSASRSRARTARASRSISAECAGRSSATRCATTWRSTPTWRRCAAPADQQVEKRIQTWFDATERYPRQLHEMDRKTYVAMKRGEYERQQALIQ